MNFTEEQERIELYHVKMGFAGGNTAHIRDILQKLGYIATHTESSVVVKDGVRVRINNIIGYYLTPKGEERLRYLNLIYE